MTPSTCNTCSARALTTTSRDPSFARFSNPSEMGLSLPIQRHGSTPEPSWPPFLDQTSLLPILDHVQQQGRVVDLQDVFNRFTFKMFLDMILIAFPLIFLKLQLRRLLTKQKSPYSTDIQCQSVFGSCRNGFKLVKRRR